MIERSPSYRSSDRGKFWKQGDVNFQKPQRYLVVCICAAMLSACSVPLPKVIPMVQRQGVAGILAADEPNAVFAAREILGAGGNAADAATALGFALTVTFPSSAGIGGGGACLVFDAQKGAAEVLDFSPQDPSDVGHAARWRTAIPTFARGMFALHAKYGNLPWHRTIIPAENLARLGFPVSRALARDLSTASQTLANDPNARNTFMTNRRYMMGEGDIVKQLDLATVLGRLRGRLPGYFYSGTFGREVVVAAKNLGATVSMEDLRAYTPRWIRPKTRNLDGMAIYLIPEEVSASNGNGTGAQVVGIEVEEGMEKYEPSATGYVVADGNGNTVACALTMLKPFGTGLMPSNMGFLLAPSDSKSGTNAGHLGGMIVLAGGSVQFAAASGGSGSSAELERIRRLVLQDGRELRQNLVSKSEFSDRGRAAVAGSSMRAPQINAIHCPEGISQNASRCKALADPDGYGYAVLVGTEG